MTLWDFYQQQAHPTLEALLAISWRGVRVDQALRAQAAEVCRLDEAQWRAALTALVGKPLDPLSPQQLMTWVYGEAQVKPITRHRVTADWRRTRTPTLDEEAIAELLTRALPERVRQGLALVLQIRRARKLLSTYLTVPLDPDGRLRCSYIPYGAETGRISSRATPFGTGTNLQNVPAGLPGTPSPARACVVPDPGHVFVQGDLSQAEARVVAHLAREERLLAVFAAGGDVHRRNAAAIFRKAEAQVTPHERQLAKTVVHASNYGMGPHKFAQEIQRPKAEAEALLHLYHNTYPRIRIWHLEVQEQLRRTRVLTTPCGRRRQFMGAWGDDLFKEAYAYVPQSTVADVLNQGLVAYHAQGAGEIVLQVHDAVVVQVPEAQLGQASQDLQTYLTRPLTINGSTCTIPVDIKQGTSWDDLH